MLGGAGAETRRRATAKSMSILRTAQLPIGFAWSLSPTVVDTAVNARVRTIVASDPGAYRKAIIEPMKTVQADTCSYRGMLEVLVAYATRLNLQSKEIFRRLLNGFDSGRIGLEGDHQGTRPRPSAQARRGH